MQEQAERPLKPGFFLANNTDRIFADTVEDAKETVAVAEVLDVIRGDAVTLLVRQPFTAADHALRLRTPEGRTVTPNLQALTDVQGQGLQQAQPGMLVRLPWQKGMVPTTILHAP